jgi:hypothetical protein
VAAEIETTCAIAYIFFDRLAISDSSWVTTKTKFLGISGLLDQLKQYDPG